MGRACGETIGPRIASVGSFVAANGRCSGQIAQLSATVAVRSCRSPGHVQRPTPSRFPRCAPRSQRRSVSELAGGDCGLNKSRALRLSFGRSQVHVTIPRNLLSCPIAYDGPRLLLRRASPAAEATELLRRRFVELRLTQIPMGICERGVCAMNNVLRNLKVRVRRVRCLPPRLESLFRLFFDPAADGIFLSTVGVTMPFGSLLSELPFSGSVLAH
jgi:hypothetical protein